jgi:DNA-binding NarL/FixJ family response regulator
MMRPTSVSRDRVIVYMVETNDLAAAFLYDILASDSSIVALRMEDALTNFKASQDDYVFILDECGLNPPIPLYLEALHRLCPNARFIVLGNEAPASRIGELLSFGLDGFLPHQEVRKSLVDAIHTVRDGKLWIPFDALEFSVRKQQRNGSSFKCSNPSITHREYQILQLVRARFTNEEIARLAHIRVSTVKFHLTNIFLKLRISNRRDLMHRPLPAIFTDHKITS